MNTATSNRWAGISPPDVVVEEAPGVGGQSFGSLISDAGALPEHSHWGDIKEMALPVGVDRKCQYRMGQYSSFTKSARSRISSVRVRRFAITDPRMSRPYLCCGSHSGAIRRT